MKTATDRTMLASSASPAMARFLRLSARARVGQLVFSSLGCGRDRVLEHLIESLGDDRPSLIFGQSIWPPAERPTKLRADITSGVRNKAELFSRLAQATPGASLIAASDCGLPLFDLVEVSVRSNVQLIYLTWVAQDDSMERVAREILAASGGTRSQQTTLAQAIPNALPIWVGIDHAPDGTFCVSRILEANFRRAAPERETTISDVRTQELFGFTTEALSHDRGYIGAFKATGVVPACFEQIADETEIGAGQLAAELFDAALVPGTTGPDFPYAPSSASSEAARARRFRHPERSFETTRRA